MAWSCRRRWHVAEDEAILVEGQLGTNSGAVSLWGVESTLSSRSWMVQDVAIPLLKHAPEVVQSCSRRAILEVRIFPAAFLLTSQTNSFHSPSQPDSFPAGPASHAPRCPDWDVQPLPACAQSAVWALPSALPPISAHELLVASASSVPALLRSPLARKEADVFVQAWAKSRVLRSANPGLCQSST
jgi:hypothetical protein